MASERDFELLDDFISNRLTGADKDYIEKKLQQDPDLRSEYGIQQQIAAGLRKARVSQLKQMLNDVPIPAQGIKPTYTKAAGTAIVIILGLAITFFLWRAEESNTDPISTQPENPAKVEQSATEEVVEELAPQDESEPEIQHPSATETRNTTSKPATRENTTPVKPDVFDPSAENDYDDSQEAPGVSEIKESTVKSSEMVVETDNTNKKYNFHYQLTDEKLILYGAFEKSLYEILEVFSNEKRTRFLFYKNAYYLLASNGKVSPLIPVNDPVLLQKLREYRTKTN